MKYHKIAKVDMNNGPGLRVAIWFSGCEFACKGCFNYKLWDFNYGQDYTQDTEDYIIECMSNDYIDGITLIGGEPLHPNNLDGVTKLVNRIKKELPEKTIWSYTGFLYEEVKHLPVVQQLDVLIDGLFDITKTTPKVKYAGSYNQRVIDVQKTIKTNKIVIYNEESEL